MRPPIARSLAAFTLAGTLATGARSDGHARQVACLPADVELSPPGAGTPLAAARTGNILVANQHGGTASLIDLETGAVDHFPTGTGPHEAAVSPDGRWGVVTNFLPMDANHSFQGNRLFVIDMAAKRVARTIDTGEHRGLHDVAFRPGFPTRVLVTAQTSRRVIEVDVESGAIIGAMDTRGDRSHMLAVSPDGRTVFTTNEGSGTLSRMDLTTHSFVSSFPATQQVEGIAVTKGGDELWVGEINDGAVTVRDATTGAVLARLPGFRAPVRLATTPDGRRVVISDPYCLSLVVADPETRRVVRVIRMPPTLPIAGDVSPDGRVAFVALGNDRAVIAVDLETGQLLARHQAGNGPDGLGWGPKP
jgi:DNA-binding beta-propeller fold protein YncE